MKRFDVCPASGPGVVGGGRLVVLLQHEHLSQLSNVVVAPLFAQGELEAIDRLRPVVVVDAHPYVVAVDLLAALPARQIGSPVANLESARYDLINALDFLFAGF
ncbi:MAG: CcdB family protein [Hyphomicrobium sp.]|nr:CcdB family protein [Hyphomicrobium sp.]